MKSLVRMEIESINADVNRQIELWQQLKAKLTLIYIDDSRVDLAFLQQCYDDVYNYMMYENRKQIALRNLGKQEFHPGKDQEVARALYYFLIGFMNDQADNFATPFNNVTQDQLLEVYARQWNFYKKINKKIQFVFRYLDRYFVSIDRDNPNISRTLEIYEVALIHWKDKIFKKCKIQLVDEIMKYFMVEREGRRIDERMVGCVIKSFLELGSVNDDLTSLCEPFELAFLEGTSNFYNAQGRKMMFELYSLKTLTFDDYMNRVHLAFANETERVEIYFDNTFIPKVIEVCEEVLIKDHLEVFAIAFEDYLTRDYLEKIDQFYDLIKRFPDDLKIFTNIFKTHVEKVGDDAIARLENVLDVDLKSYIGTLIGISEKYENLIKIDMDNNENFLSALEDAMRFFVNENAVTHASKFGDVNGELLAKYCDKLLSGDSDISCPVGGLKTKLHHAWRIFKVLKDKDGFQKFYENITARRLIFNLTISPDDEKFFIEKMKEFFGKQDSKSLRDICENMKISHEMNKEFRKQYLEKDSTMLENFSVAVLSERSWPFQNASLYAVSQQFIENLPPTLSYTAEKFVKYYGIKFSGIKQPTQRKIETLGRKIQFLHNLGKGEMHAEFLNKTYVLQVGAFQMTILMQFNDKSKFSYKELMEKAGISTAPNDFLMETMSKLFETRILRCAGDYKQLNEKTEIELNIDFKDSRNQINLDHVIDAEQEINRKEIWKYIDNDRENLTQCAIARIMKRKKRLHRTDLMMEVTEECKKRFKPEAEMIKRSFQLSVGKDIIKVDESDSNYYIYLE